MQKIQQHCISKPYADARCANTAYRNRRLWFITNEGACICTLRDNKNKIEISDAGELLVLAQCKQKISVPYKIAFEASNHDVLKKA